MLTALLRAGGDADEIVSGVRILRGSEADNVAELELGLGDGASLVEGEGGDAGEPFERRPAFDEHARPRQSAQGGERSPRRA